MNDFVHKWPSNLPEAMQLCQRINHANKQKQPNIIAHTSLRRLDTLTDNLS